MKRLNIALVAHDARKKELVNSIYIHYITITLLLLVPLVNYLAILWLNKLQRQIGERKNIL